MIIDKWWEEMGAHTRVASHLAMAHVMGHAMTDRRAAALGTDTGSVLSGMGRSTRGGFGTSVGSTSALARALSTTTPRPPAGSRTPGARSIKSLRGRKGTLRFLQTAAREARWLTHYRVYWISARRHLSVGGAPPSDAFAPRTGVDIDE